ncbi:MAG TPA: hotdog fold thioesterase [Acidimicrobiales bacterium]|nr:hotdog fold thioesterase [Acidimicrobiales bacterium]
MSGDAEGRTVDRRHPVSEYFRLERWEIPPPPGVDALSDSGGRAPVDAHLRGSGGGLRTGGLLTSIDSLGGFLCGLAVLPEGIVTTSMMATISQLDHRGPLRLHGRVLRRGRNSVVAGLDVVDEGRGGLPVAAATMTCAVLDPGGMVPEFERPCPTPMAPLDPGAPGPEEFFCIEPGVGPVTRLELTDRLRNPWGILHGGAAAVLADVAACRAAQAGPSRPQPTGLVAAADTVLHYLRPARVGPIEARCQVVGRRSGRAVVRVAIHDVGAGDRVVTLGSVAVLDV